MYSIFQYLLDLKGVSVADVARETGINQSTLSNWKKRNNLLSAKNAKLIADYFDVSVDFLMTGEEPSSTEHYYINEETREIAEEIRTNKELKLLFSASRDASPEDLKTVHQMLLALKRKERHDDE